MSSVPRVSVVIPTYNHASFVLRTLASVFGQTVTDFEVIVVNDGSPDHTDQLVMPLADAGKIRYFKQANAGQAAARNRGIAVARGTYIALLDDDDLWPPNALEAHLATLENSGDCVSYGLAELINEQGDPLSPVELERLPFTPPQEGPSGDVYGAFLRRNYILSPGQTLIRRRSLDELGEQPFDPALPGVDDYDLYLRLGKIGTFAFLPQVTLRYRIHSGNASRNEAHMHCQEMALYRKHYRSAADRVAVRHAWRERRGQLSRYWLATTLRAFTAGRLTDAATRFQTLCRLLRS